MIRVTSILYLLALAGLFFYVARFVALRVFTVDGRGRVELTRIYVGAGQEGVVRDILVAEREHVEPVQLVAVLSLVQAKENERQTPTLIQRDILGTANDLAKMRSRRELLKSRLADKSRLLNEFMTHEQLKRSLEIALSEDTEAARLARQVEELKFSISELDAEIRHEQEYLRELERAAEIPAPEAPQTETALFSTNSGTVVGIFKGLRDFLSKQEVLMAVVPDGAKVRVRAEFDTEYLEHLGPGRSAAMIFPDGLKLEAKIGKIYAASSRLRAAEHNPPRDLNSKVEVEILPDNPEDYVFWERYNNMDIGIRVRREWFDLSF